MRRAMVACLAVAAVGTFVAPTQVAAQEPEPQKRDFRPRRFLPEQPPIVQFEVKAAAEVANTLDAAELVLGVAVAGEARAYPLNMLTGPRRGVINDRLGDRPIAATWCHHSHNGIVYARKVRDRTMTFGVSGLEWNSNLVMYDPETYSYWSHQLGLAMTGPMEGAELEQLPSVITDWESWTKRYPQTTVLWLPRTSRDYQTSFYRTPDQFVLGIAKLAPPHAWRFADLLNHPITNDKYIETPVVIAFDQDTMTARMFERQFRGRVLHFERDAQGFIDRESRSLWDRLTGKCIAGYYQGQQLKVLSAIVSYRKSWMAFHPDTVIQRQR